MVFDSRTYSVLVVSSSEKVSQVLRAYLSDGRCYPVTQVGSIAAAKRCVLENEYDMVIIDAPLPDDMGTKFAIDISSDKSTVCLMLVRSDLYEDIRDKAAVHGIFTVAKPTSGSMLAQGIAWMKVARERVRKQESKAVTIEEKMEEIRLVNRAKWVLIQTLNMTEPDAHRYIEKQAMDQCLPRRQIAESILRTYK